MKRHLTFIACMIIFNVLQAQNPIAYYPLNGNANDSIGNIHGIINGATTTTDRYQYPAGAFNFGGSNQYINLGNSSILKPTSELTVSVWFELNNAGTLTGRSMISNTENGGYNLQYIHSGQTIRGNVWRNGSYAVLTAPAAAYINTGWHQAVLTFDGRYSKLFIDGILKSTNDAGAIYPITYPPTTNTYIGAEPVASYGIDGSLYWRGKLDEIKLYHIALTENQVFAQYVQPGFIPEVGLSLWVRADSGIHQNNFQVTQWEDISGHGNHLIQADLSKQPLQVLQEINNNPVIRFDGVNDILHTLPVDLTNTTQLTVFIVNKTSNDNAILIEQTSDINTHTAGFGILDNYNYSLNHGFSAFLKGNSTANNGISAFRSGNINYNFKVSTITYDKSATVLSNQIKAVIDGIELSNTHGYGDIHTDAFLHDTVFIGGRGNGIFPLDGDIAEILIYDRLLNETEKNQVELYLNQRYKLSQHIARFESGSGKCLTFDGSNDYTHISDLPATLSDFTVSYWIKNNGADGTFDRVTSTSGDAFEIAKNSTGNIMMYRGGWTGPVTNIGTQEWVHLAFVRQNAVLKVYKNGLLVSTYPGFGASGIAGAWRLGGRVAGGEHSNMSLDEFRIYSIALSETQIRDQMCSKLSAADSLYSFLYVYYSFDDSLLSTTYDASYHARHGSLLNGPFRELSGAPVGNQSAFDYNGAASSINLLNADIGEFEASLTSGTASGIHVYSVHELPSNKMGIDTLATQEAYFGVFVANSTAAAYDAKFHYTGYAGFSDEQSIRLFKREHNAAPFWADALGILNTDSNFISMVGQQTEYILVHNPILTTYYADMDGDGYGNPLDSILAVGQPLSYVLNNTDCNDLDSLEFPDQVWYTDADQDGFGNGIITIQCERPLHGFVQSELQAISGDCDDNQAFIYPGYRLFTFSENPGYSNTVISQQVGDSYTTFHFQVKYFDATGGFPGATFPRVQLDYEGNGVFTNPNDRTIILNEDDITDQNTVDGKTYSGSINALPIGSNWKTSVHMQPSACAENFGAFDYPDVLVLPDLEIFASDISFSVSNPPISSPLTIHAVVHNVSDFAATDFLVRIRDQYDTTLVFADIPVPVLAAHSSINLSWNLTTIALPSWHPIEVIVDATHVIDESNELDNSAIRPYINGNYNVPGSIGTISHVSPSVAYALGSQYATLNGKAFYTGLAVPLADSGVAGATIQFTILETGATFTTHTNANGNYSYTFPRPTTAGLYHITGTCTDFTLSGNLSATFELIAPPVNTLCTLANLTTSILVSNEKVVQGDSITGNIIISNTGQTAAPASVVYMTHTQGIPTLPDSIIVPALLPTQLFNFPFSMQFDSIGFLSICAQADATELIEECSEQNNSCKLIQVVPPLPDIVITNGPGLQAYKCAISEVSITLRNYGGIETGPFQCKILTKKNGVLIQTDIATIPNILSTLIHPTAQYNVTIPFTPSVTGVYTFEAEADFLNEVAELSDSNNTASYSTSILECKPNFYPLSCQSFTVNSTNNQYTTGSSINGTVQIKNSGNAVYQGNLTVRFLISGGGTVDTTVYVNLSPNQGILVTAQLQAPSTPGSSITVIVDPMNLIDEFNESDNEVSNDMCWDFEPVDLQNCGIDFWDEPRLKNQAASIYVGVRSNALYRADSLKVKFEVSGPGLSGTVNLGYVIIHPFFNTCGCPQIAYLPYSFIYPEVGTYQFIITVDPDNEFPECSESNNILIRSVNVYNQPDMRILSQHIAPSKLNPDPNESIQFNITYENIGAENINDEMKLHVWVDNALIDSIYPAYGLMPYGNTTFSIPASWSSGMVGAHVIRAVIDADHQVNETNELNNEATRVVVVGEAANLYVQAFQSNTPAPSAGTSISIQTRIGNSGDKNCQANVELYYVDQQHDTVMFYTQQVEVDAHDSISFITNWIVAIPQTTIIAKIVNASELEYTYDDNQSTFRLGELVLLLRQQPACSSGNTMGSLHAHLIGGQPPYNFFWQNGLSGEIIQAAPGIYSIHATDNSGQSISGIANIDTCPDVTLHLNFFLQGYYQSTGQMVTAISNQGKYSFPNDVDSVLVELRLDSIGYTLLDSYRGIVSTDGSMPCYFYNPQLLGKSCFIVISHRNTVKTWSATPITLVAETLYDFSTSASKAFGNNQSDVSGNAVTWALYSGDLNQDENVDLIDGNILDFSTENYEFGYQFTDLNGDGNVDLLDNPVLEENISNFIFAEYP